MNVCPQSKCVAFSDILPELPICKPIFQSIISFSLTTGPLRWFWSFPHTLRCFASASVPAKGCGGEPGKRQEQSSQVFGRFDSLPLLNVQQLLQLRFGAWTDEENTSVAVFRIRALRVGNTQAITSTKA
jgi:hypothetical protein